MPHRGRWGWLRGNFWGWRIERSWRNLSLTLCLICTWPSPSGPMLPSSRNCSWWTACPPSSFGFSWSCGVLLWQEWMIGRWGRCWGWSAARCFIWSPFRKWVCRLSARSLSLRGGRDKRADRIFLLRVASILPEFGTHRVGWVYILSEGDITVGLSYALDEYVGEGVLIDEWVDGEGEEEVCVNLNLGLIAMFNAIVHQIYIGMNPINLKYFNHPFTLALLSSSNLFTS